MALAAVRDIENVKAAKYRSVALERGATFTAFIVESYGALGGQGLELLKLLLLSVADCVPLHPYPRQLEPGQLNCSLRELERASRSIERG